jgi:hypothetical protein
MATNKNELRYGSLGSGCFHVCVDMQKLFAEDTEWKTPWIADAAQPLYDTLDNHQRQRLVQFIRQDLRADLMNERVAYGVNERAMTQTQRRQNPRWQRMRPFGILSVRLDRNVSRETFWSDRIF